MTNEITPAEAATTTNIAQRRPRKTIRVHKDVKPGDILAYHGQGLPHGIRPDGSHVRLAQDEVTGEYFRPRKLNKKERKRARAEATK